MRFGVENGHVAALASLSEKEQAPLPASAKHQYVDAPCTQAGMEIVHSRTENLQQLIYCIRYANEICISENCAGICAKDAWWDFSTDGYAYRLVGGVAQG